MIVFISSSTSLGSSPERSFSRRAEWEDFRESVLGKCELHPPFDESAAYKDFSQAPILATSTLSSIPLTPA